MATNLGALLEQAAARRNAGNWAGAEQLYKAAAAASPGRPEVHHNLALCLHARGLHREAFEHAESATRKAPGLAPAWVLRAKIERALGEAGAAAASLKRVLIEAPGQPQALMELAGLTLNEFGDARAAQRLVAPLLGHPQYDEDARLATLMAKLYDRDESAGEFTRQIVAYSEKYLRMPGFAYSARRKPRPGGKKAKKRVGLLSPLFSASPVYFFARDALSLLRDEVDFVVLNRGTREDWATQKFRDLAREWVDVAHLPAEALANAIWAESLDVLIDLGGWTDPVALKALSAKPASMMYKWVGGQSCTTGLAAFDGFFSDNHHTPASARHLYVEPIVRFQPSYVAYEGPAGQRLAGKKEESGKLRGKLRRGKAQQEKLRYGVISNPVKVSSRFLDDLKSFRWLAKPAAGCALAFIDRRYRLASARARVSDAIGSACRDRGVEVEFLAPSSHAEFLDAVSGVDAIIDTFPYSGGLTVAEALAMGVTDIVYRKDGRLFCERHCLAHRAAFRERSAAGVAHELARYL